MKRKKKILAYGFLASVALFLVCLVVAVLMIDLLIKKTVESVGPKMTGTTFTLDRVTVRMLKGSGKLTGLTIGNPKGYTSDFALKIDEALLDVHPGTVFKEKLVVDSIQVVGPEISFEGGQSENNLKEIGRNIAEFIGSMEEREKLDRRLQVNHFLLEDARVHLRINFLGKRTITLSAPRIELHDLGKGPEGLTSAELTELIIGKINETVGAMVAGAMADFRRDRAAEPEP